MTYLDLDRDELNREIVAACARFVELLRALKPEDALLPVTGLVWDVGELAAHVLTVVRRGLGDCRRSDSPEATAELNAIVLHETPERDIARLADLIAQDNDTMLTIAFPRVADDRRFPFHAGTTTTIIPAMAIVLGEFTMHGYDIATATGHPWTIAPHTAALIWKGCSDVFSGWLKPQAAPVNESYVLHFEGEPAPLSLVVREGTARVSFDIPAAPDYVLRVNPAEFIFYSPYQRRTPTDPSIARLISLFKTL